MGETASKILERCFLPYVIWFFIGVFFQTCRLYEKICVRKIVFLLIPIHAIMRISGLGDVGYYTGTITGIITASLTIVAAMTLPKMNFNVDLTYGIYLYHWLFLNIIIHFEVYEKVSWISCLILYTVMTLIFAYVFRLEILSRFVISIMK